MSGTTDEKTARYCPECGKRFVAAAAQFAEPRVCPACKTRVFFIDYPRETPPEFAETDEQLDKRDPKVQQRIVLLIVSSALAILAFCMIALLSGQLTAFFVLACVALVGGIIAISIYLDGVSKAVALSSAYQMARARLRFHETNQTRLVHHVRGMQKNYDQMLQQELATLHEEHAGLLRDAAADRSKAAEELANADALLATERKRLNAESNVVRTHAMEQIAQYDSAARDMCERLLSEVRKSIKSRLTPNNFATSKERFMKTVAFCEKKGYSVSQAMIDEFAVELHQDYEEAVRKQAAKEEQARIREKIREEERAERELEREMRRMEAEQNAIQKALAEALARTKDEHSAEVESLRQRLAEAEAKAERAKSMAQLTKAGNVYVISNIGSFGESVFKIGMTRRLEPMDRVKELGDASVPFPFDVHMMISSDDAPALEASLHRAFNHRRVNRVNLRKEFFRVEIDEIIQVVQEHQGQVDYVAEPEALEYNESLTMTEDDFVFVSSQVDAELLPEG